MSRILSYTQLLAAFLVALALTLGGCGSDSSPVVVVPPVVEEPTFADPPPAVPQNAPVARTIYAQNPVITFTSATVVDDALDANDGRLTVEFRVIDESTGQPMANISSFNGFVVAQLIQQTGANPNYWQSYINRTDAGAAATNAPGAGADGLALYPLAIQATTENNGTLTNLGNGNYRYLFNKNLKTGPYWPTGANPATDLDYTFLGDAELAFDATRTHRVGVQLNRVTTGTTRAAANAWYDFRPDGQPVVAGTQTKNVTTTQSCNACHDGRLGFHGSSSRVELEYCVTCHNPGTVDGNSGSNLDMGYMVHKIHRGAMLPSVKAGGEYIIWGNNNTPHDYSDIHYPSLYYGFTGEPFNCTTCHTGGSTITDVNNWYTKTSDLACFSCHDQMVAGKTFIYNGLDTEGAPRSYVTHTLTSSIFFPDGATINDVLYDQYNLPKRTCGGCHTGTAFNSRRTFHVHEHDFRRPQFQYIIENVSVNANRQPVITFRIKMRENGAGANTLADGTRVFTDMDLLADLPSVQPYVAGTGTAFSQTIPLTGGPNFALLYAPAGSADWDLTRPLGQPETVTLANLRNGTGGTLVANGNGSFTATLNAAFPEGVTRRAVFMQGYFTMGTTRLDTPSPLVYVQGDIQRRQVVAQDKCLGCHGGIGFHGGNRVDNPQVCAGCHNPRLTSSGHLITSTNNSLGRTGLPEDEVTNNLKDMIHGIHAGTLVGGRNQGSGLYYDFTTIHYPGVLSNCLACHNEGTYERPAANAAVTTNLTMDRTSAAPGADDRVTSPYAASCVGCHNSTQARSHIETAGGWVRDKRSDAQATEGGCLLCHGPGATIAPVSGVHSGLQ